MARCCGSCGQQLPSVEDEFPHLQSRRFEYHSWKSNKFWTIWRDSVTIFVKYGAIGTCGVTIQKRFDTRSEAIDYASSKVREKLGKGYEEV